MVYASKQQLIRLNSIYKSYVNKESLWCLNLASTLHTQSRNFTVSISISSDSTLITLFLSYHDTDHFYLYISTTLNLLSNCFAHLRFFLPFFTSFLLQGHHLSYCLLHSPSVCSTPTPTKYTISLFSNYKIIFSSFNYLKPFQKF